MTPGSWGPSSPKSPRGGEHLFHTPHHPIFTITPHPSTPHHHPSPPQPHPHQSPVVGHRPLLLHLSPAKVTIPFQYCTADYSPTWIPTKCTTETGQTDCCDQEHCLFHQPVPLCLLHLSITRVYLLFFVLKNSFFFAKKQIFDPLGGECKIYCGGLPLHPPIRRIFSFNQNK